MELKTVISGLEKLAPTKLAEKWDNVGLLLEPSGPFQVKSMLLTNDLTEDVLEEAIQKKVNMIISYHPPIFVAMKRLTQRDVKERIVIKCIENKIAIYSPHTAMDCAKGGVNDWLAETFPQDWIEKTKPLQPRYEPFGELGTFSSLCKLVVYVPQKEVEKLRQELGKIDGVSTIGNYSHCTFSLEGKGSFMGNENSNPSVGNKQQLEFVDEVRLETVFNKSKLVDVVNTIKKNHSYETPAFDIYSLEGLPVEGVGIGRMVTFKEKKPLSEIIERAKKHLHLPAVRLATPLNSTKYTEIGVKTVAICAGAGASVLEGVSADLYYTGEMSHHQVLAATAKNTSVLLCEHSNTERGFLQAYKTKIEKVLQNNQIEIFVSQKDQDPLIVV